MGDEYVSDFKKCCGVDPPLGFYVPYPKFLIIRMACGRAVHDHDRPAAIQAWERSLKKRLPTCPDCKNEMTGRLGTRAGGGVFCTHCMEAERTEERLS